MWDSEADVSASDDVTGEGERRQQQMETLESADLPSVAEALQFSEHALVQTPDAHRLRVTARNRQTQPEMSHHAAVPTGTPEEHVKILQISAHETQTDGERRSSPKRKHRAGVEVSGQVCGLQQLLHLSEPTNNKPCSVCMGVLQLFIKSSRSGLLQLSKGKTKCELLLKININRNVKNAKCLFHF